MKYLIILLFLGPSLSFSADFVWSKSLSSSQKKLSKKAFAVWPESASISDSAAFSQVIELAKNDPVAVKLLNDVNAKLNSGGISNVLEIIRFCGSETYSEATGAFKQNAETLEVRANIPGVQTLEWPLEAQEKLKTSFHHKVIRLPFIDILVISTKPSLCLQRNIPLQEAYDVLIHELTHFLKRDVYFDIENKYVRTGFDNYLEQQIMQSGGEYDGYFAGISAGIKLRKSLGIVNPNKDFPYFDVYGALTDEAAFKAMLFNTYGSYYEDPKTLEGQIKNAYGMQTWRLSFLEEYVKPKVQDLTVLRALETEIIAVRNQVRTLKESYPSILP